MCQDTLPHKHSRNWVDKATVNGSPLWIQKAASKESGIRGLKFNNYHEICNRSRIFGLLLQEDKDNRVTFEIPKESKDINGPNMLDVFHA